MASESNIPTPATPDVCTVSILTGGTQIPGSYHLLSVTVNKELNRIPSATLYFYDGEASRSTFEISNSETFIPGKEIEILLGYRSQNDTVFKGVIVSHSVRVRRNSSMLIVECRDKAIGMTLGRKNKYFAEQKDSEIMEQIIGNNGLQKEVEATTTDLKEVVQFDSSDWDFLLCRAEANGHVVLVEDGKVTVSKPATGSEAVVSVSYGNTLLELDAVIDARVQSESIKAESWNPADQQVIGAEAREPETTGNGNLSADVLSAASGGRAHNLVHGGVLSQPELQIWADGRLLKERLSKTRGTAKFQGFAGVLPGKIIELSGIGERFEGKLYVSGVRHTVADGNWETDVQLGLNPDLFAETVNLRPLPASGLLPGIGGLQIGKVTQLENDPAGEDRIKVRLPVISTSDEGIWARISTLDAGDQRGTYFRPEIDDEVIVGFLNDDPRNPVVLGMCHSSAKPAPEQAKDSNHLKGYTSREKMRFSFDDEKKTVILETPGGNKLTLSEDTGGIEMEDQNGNKITMNDSGITIESSKDLILKAVKDIKIEGINMGLKASSSFKAEGTGSVELSGANATLKGSATAVIQGGVVQIN
ncbi:MAG: type VI secretion system tip protein VgrG [Bacteroidales bacterium]|nr:type VI secretion system tip protein VgrG [Bacteroidales bacterium]